MTTAAICATREPSWNPSSYRGEQYDSDLGLYYPRARYYNPNTDRFMSRDPEDGKAKDPASLHKYLYADGDPVNGFDPTGRGDAGVEFALITTTIVQRTIPAVIAFVGQFVTEAAIPWIASTLNIGAAIASGAAAVAVFIDDVLATKMAQGLMKFYACSTLTTYATDLLINLDSVNLPPETKKTWETQIDRGLMEACGIGLGMAGGGNE